jgi:hypothetical protein
MARKLLFWLVGPVALLTASVVSAQTFPAYSSGETRDDGSAIQADVGASLYVPGFDTLACSSFSPNYGKRCDARSSPALSGLMKVDPLPWRVLDRLQLFAKWDGHFLGSPGIGRQYGIAVRLPGNFTLGFSNHRYHVFVQHPESVDGSGGGLWAGAFIEKDFFNKSEEVGLREGFMGVVVYPPHNEFDPKACAPEVGLNAQNKCDGFARYKVYGGVRLLPIRGHRKMFLDLSGFSFLGNNAPQTPYTSSMSPISAGGRIGGGFAFNHNVSFGVYHSLYVPLGRYSNRGLLGAYSNAGPYGGNSTGFSVMVHFGFGREKKEAHQVR